MTSRKRQSRLKTMQHARERRIDHDLTSRFEQGPIVVPLTEETLKVKKNWVQAGEVILRKTVDTHTEDVPVKLGYDEVQVERVAANRVLREDEKAEPRQEGDTWVIPVIQEELVVSKRRVVKEEIHVTKRRLTREETAREEVRSENIGIETSGELGYLNNESPPQA